MTPGQLTLTLPPTPRAFAGLPSLMGSGAVFFVLSATAQIVSGSLTGQNELTSRESDHVKQKARK